MNPSLQTHPSFFAWVGREDGRRDLSPIQLLLGVGEGLLVSVVDCRPRCNGFKSQPGQNCTEISAPRRQRKYNDHTLSVKRRGGEGDDKPPPSCAEGRRKEVATTKY